MQYIFSSVDYNSLISFFQMAVALADRAIGAIVGSAVADAAGINIKLTE